jgi:hypothetical protein
LLTNYLYTFSLYENPSLIIFSAETKYISTRSWYRNINFLRDRIMWIFYEADFIQGLLKKNEKKLARSFNFTFRYIDDVLSLNNSRFCDFVDRIYPIELEIKNTTDTDRSTSYLDLHLEIASVGRLRTKLYNKRDLIQFSHCELSIYM